MKIIRTKSRSRGIIIHPPLTRRVKTLTWLGATAATVAEEVWSNIEAKTMTGKF